MVCRIVDAGSVEAGMGPHPAGSPFDKRLTRALGITAFEVYQVELPPGQQTVAHTHVSDQVEDVYAVVAGWGWVDVDDEAIPIRPGHFVAVTIDSTRLVRAGTDGLVFIALCSAPPRERIL